MRTAALFFGTEEEFRTQVLGSFRQYP